MADQKISELTALTGANLADVDAFAVVDTSAVQTKKITYAELKTALDTGTGFVRITGDTMTGNLIVPQVEIGDGSAGGTSELLFSDNVSARGKIKYNHGSNPEVLTIETTGTTALTIDNAQKATFSGDLQAAGLYVGATNTSYDFYNNGTSYLNGATTVDDNLTVNGTVTSTGNITAGGSTAGVFTAGSANGFEMQKSGVNAYINQSDSGPIIVRMGSGYSEKLRLTSTGNLGINAIPTQKLHVGGNAIITGLTRLGNGTESSPSYQFVDDTNTGMYKSSSDVLGFSTGGTNRLTLNSTGATFAGTVHIIKSNVSQSWSDYSGTTLTLEEASNDGNILQFISNNASTGELWFGDDDSRNVGRVRYEHDVNKLEFWTAGTERASIGSTGQLLVNPLGVSTPTFSFTNDTNTGMTRPTSDTLQFVTGGSERVRIDASGNLGLGGTPATNTKLLVKAGTNLNLEVENSSSNLRLSALNDARSANVGMQFASSAFEFLTGATTFNNNVAISSSSGDSLTLTKTTTEPSLRIEGDTNKDFVFTISEELLTLTQNDGATDIVTFDHDTKAATFAGTVSAPLLSVSTSSTKMAEFNSTHTNHGYIVLKEDGTDKFYMGASTAVSGQSVGFTFYTASGDGIDFNTGGNSTPRLRITSDGNVGIGTTSTSSIRLQAVTPTANHVGLQVENSNTADSFGMVVKGGNDANDYTADFRKRDNTNIMRIRGDGNIGIGLTSNIDRKLHVQNDNDYAAKFGGTGSGDYAIEIGQSGTGGSAGLNATGSGGSMKFSIAGSEKARIAPAGQFAIGQTSPQSYHSSADDLVIGNGGSTGITIRSGTTNAGSIFFADGTSGSELYRGYVQYSHHGTASSDMLRLGAGGADRLMILSTGLVGINTTSPEHDLHVKTAGQTEDGIIKVGGTDASLGLEISYDQSSVTTTKIISNPTYGNNSAVMHIAVDGDTNPNQLVLKGDGMTGIGTAAPKRHLHINGGNETTKIQITNQTTGSGSDGDGFQIGIASDGTANIEQRENNDLAFYTNNTLRQKIDSAGHVMIGTTVEGETGAHNLTVADSGNAGITIRAGATSSSAIYMSDATSGAGEYGSYIAYAHNTGILSIATASSARMTLDSSGNVGIGTTSPNGNGLLTINTPTNNSPQIVFSENNTAKWLIGHRHDGDHFRFYDLANSAERMRIDSNGRVGIGTTAPDNPLEVVGADSGIKISASSSHRPMLRFECGSDEKLILSSNTTYGAIGDASDANRYMVFKDGNVGFSVADWNSSSGGLLIQDSSGVSQVNFSRPSSYTGTQNVNLYYHNGSYIGGINTTTTATSFVTSSDYRLKENVDYTWDATTRLKQLKPARFNFIADDTNTLVDGFLAHEVSSVVPEAITGTKDAVDADGNPEYQGIDQSKLVPLLVKTIQELEARITALEA